MIRIFIIEYNQIKINKKHNYQLYGPMYAISDEDFLKLRSGFSCSRGEETLEGL